jgi:hypothetical protein
VLRCGVVDHHCQLPLRDALFVREPPSVGGLDDDVVVLAAVEALWLVFGAGEGGEELAVHDDPAARIGVVVDDDVGDVMGGWVRGLQLTKPLDDLVTAAALDAARAAAVVDRGVREEQFGEPIPLTLVDQVAITPDQLMDEDDVDGVEHVATVTPAAGRPRRRS